MKTLFKYSYFISVILAFLFIPFIVYYISILQQKDQIPPKVLAAEITPAPTQSPRESRLADIVNRNFADDDKDYAIVIKNFKTREEYKFNENKKFDSASLYKLWVLAVVTQKIKDGEIDDSQGVFGDLTKLNKTLETEPEEVNPSSSPSPEDKKDEEPKGISMTVKEAMEKMIINSDNYAALLLTQKVGVKNVSKFLNDYGLADSKFGSPPKTTPHDIALYYEKLYNGEIIDKESSEKMIELLKRQAINDRLPKYLPNGIPVAHKTGELYGSKHDAGIVFGDKGDYEIVVMTNTTDPAFAAERVAKFSKEVYEYFENENQNPN